MSIEKIYVKDVIERAGYNRSTFYKYFADIYCLLDYVENDIINSIQARIKESGNNAAELMGFFEQKEVYLKALLGSYGRIHFLDKLKNELFQYLDLQLIEVEDFYEPRKK